MDTIIHVCYAVKDISGSYSKFVGASLCSLLENTKNHVVAHIIHDNTFTEENINLLTEMVRSYDQEIYFYNISILPSVEDVVTQIQQVFTPRNQGMLYRLLLGPILPSDIEKIIYLDADTIVQMDIAKLWDVPLGDVGIAAVPDSVIAMLPIDMAPWVVKNGLVQQDKYFNSGMLVVNMNYLRQHSQIVDDMVDFLVKNEAFMDYPDQNYLNYVFKESCLLLPTDYNYLINYARLKKIYEKEAIFHYAGGALKLDTKDTFDALYWHYLFKTPWQNAFATMHSLSDLASNCRDLYEMVKMLKFLLKKNERLILGSRKLSSSLESSISGTFYDSGEDETTKLNCSDILDVFFSLPPDERVIVVVSRHYTALKNLFVNIGLKEGSDFVDGSILTLPEKTTTYFDDSSIIGRY